MPRRAVKEADLPVHLPCFFIDVLMAMNFSEPRQWLARTASAPVIMVRPIWGVNVPESLIAGQRLIGIFCLAKGYVIEKGLKKVDRAVVWLQLLV